ncbi:MAG: DNA primase small subunit domain-containing protein [Desulfurococcaceae archaeon]
MLPRELTSTKQFLKQLIREYYSKKPLEEPADLHKREIALESLEDESYIRHLSFPYMDDLYNYILRVKTPLHLYYSSAIYANPSASRMEDKIWEGSELMFDIDADKYKGCEIKYWICPRTGSIHEVEIDKCENGDKPLVYSYIPWNCIVNAWNDVLKLINVLKDDFGFERIKIYFSGNRGFHVKVFDTKALLYDRDTRRAIAEYVSCSDIVLEKMFPAYRNNVVFGKKELGIRKRVLDLATARGLVKLKKEFKGLRDVFIVDVENVQKLLEEVCIKVDKSVTMDISRLSRFNGSLNMKSGLRTAEVDLGKGIEGFTYASFTPFKGSIRVRSLVTAKIPVLDSTVDLSKGSIIKLDSYIAIHLIVKGFVVPVDASDLEVKV